jgi:hypothetical protein
LRLPSPLEIGNPACDLERSDDSLPVHVTWRLDAASRPRPGSARAQDGLYQTELLYDQVAANLGPLVNADTVIAAGDIGARILDTLGLISPQTARYYPLDASVYVINYAMPLQLILDQQPDWIVSPQVYIRNGLLKEAQFEAQYQLFETLTIDIYGSNGLMVFRRK